MRSFLFVLAVTVAIAGSSPADPSKELSNAPLTGSFELNFSERSPASSFTEQSRRFGWNLESVRRSFPNADYELEKEAFDVFVPKSYKADQKWGLLVWISPAEIGAAPPQWHKTLEKHKLIWVGARKAGNERAPIARTGLAVDAAFNMKQKYSIDPARVFVSGMSGGGRISSLLGVVYSDVFTGGIYICGCDFYEALPVPDQPGKAYQKLYAAPPGRLLTDAKRKSRHVFLTGDKDFNRTQTIATHEKGFKKEGFEHTEYFEVPGMGHELPSAEWFEKAVAFLDATPAQDDSKTMEAMTVKAEADLKAARALMEKDIVAGYEALERVGTKFGRTEAGKQAAIEVDKLKPKVEDARAADKILRVARLYAENRMYASSRAKLKQLLADYPNAPAVKDAKELLKAIGESD